MELLPCVWRDLCNMEGSDACRTAWRIVRRLVAAGAVSANVKMGADNFSAKATLLHVAAAWGTADDVKFLLQANADPSATTEDGQRPMHWAVRFNRENKAMAPELLGKCKLLPLEHLAATDFNRQTPLHVLLEYQPVSLFERILGVNKQTPTKDVLYWMLQQTCCPLQHVDCRGFTPLMCCCGDWMMEAMILGAIRRQTNRWTAARAAWLAGCCM